MSLESYLNGTTVLDKAVLRQFASQGLPEAHRALVWKVICEYLPENTSLHASKQKVKRREYVNLAHYHYSVTRRRYPKAWENVKVQVDKDIGRTWIRPFKLFKCAAFRKAGAGV